MKLFALAVVALSLAPATTYAAGFALGEQSAVAAATGGAGTARADDASAAWYNPAALATGTQPRWRAGVGLLALTPQLRADATRTLTTVKTPPHVYASYAWSRWATGLAVNVPFGSGVAWPAGWAGQFESVESSIQVVRASPFAAARVGRFRLAAGPYVDFATVSSRQMVDFVDTTGEVAVLLRGFAAGVHVAGYAELTPALALGATYKSRTRVRLSGTADFDVPDAFSGRAPDQRATSELNLPDLFSMGGRYSLTDRWTLFGDVGLATWNVHERIRIDFEDENTTDVNRATDWRARPSFRAGAAFRLSSRWVFRGGGFYDMTPAPTETLAPSSPDSNRLGVTLGAGTQLGGGLRANAFYSLMHLQARKSQNSESLPATYRGTVHMLGVGVQLSR